MTTDDDGRIRAATLTGRHADILVLLSRHPEGLSADHLAVLLDDKDLDVVTMRAEMSRLRKVIGADYLALPAVPTVGADRPATSAEVFAALDAGTSSRAHGPIPGPLLPQSVSPAIARLRTQLSATLRAAVLPRRAGCPLLRRWLELPEAATTGTAGRRCAISASARRGRARPGARPSGRPGLRVLG